MTGCWVSGVGYRENQIPDEVIALLEPVHGTSLRVLCVDGNDVFPTTVDASHITAVSRAEPVWYPYAAGSFGVEMML